VEGTSEILKARIAKSIGLEDGESSPSGLKAADLSEAENGTDGGA
jgi:hypothetical protein